MISERDYESVTESDCVSRPVSGSFGPDSALLVYFIPFAYFLCVCVCVCVFYMLYHLSLALSSIYDFVLATLSLSSVCVYDYVRVCVFVSVQSPSLILSSITN